MQYLFGTLAALAITAQAAPGLHWRSAKGFNTPEVDPPFPLPDGTHTGVLPTGTTVLPTGAIRWPTAVPTGWAQVLNHRSQNNKQSMATGSPSAGNAKGPGKLPPSSGTVVLEARQTVAAGTTFDGGMKSYDRGVQCTGQSEGGDSDAVFFLEKGATLQNVIIGPNQKDGVHCAGACTLKNVWWSAVCEDAFSIKKQAAGETTRIIGGGAFGADDKVLQHNGAGTLSVSGFTAETFGKLYRSCGNCKTMSERHVILDNIYVSDGSSIVGINSNYGDTAKLTNIVASNVKDICVEYKGNSSGDEPTKIGSGPSNACQYSPSDIKSS